MLKKSLSVAAMLALITGTIDARGMGHGYGKYQNSNYENRHVQQATTDREEESNTSDVTNTTLSEELANTLSYMGNEERLAYDVYNRLYEEWGIKQFQNIASKSEVKHIEAVQQLVQKYKLNDDVSFTNVDLPALGYVNTEVENMEAGTYDISKIQRLYDDLVSQGSRSEIDALKVGCMVEVIDINDLDEYIEISEKDDATDITTLFEFLRKGSYNHYWAFDKGLKNKGVSEGCCSVGDAYCHPEYPQNEQGNGNGQGNGNDQGTETDQENGNGHGFGKGQGKGHGYGHRRGRN